MNLSWIFVFFLYQVVPTALRSEIATHVGGSANELNLQTIGRLRYGDGEIVISQNQAKQKEFFFTPLPFFQPTGSDCHENLFTDRLELGLRIEFHPSDVVQSVQEYLQKHQSSLCGMRSSSFLCEISLLPMSSIRIVQRNGRSNDHRNKYVLDETWQSAAFLSQSMSFRLYLSNRTVCEKLRSALTDRCDLSNFEFQYTIADERKTSKELEVTTEHITNTVLYRRIRTQFLQAESVMLTEEDLKELIKQSIERMTLELRVKENFLTPEDLQRLEKQLEQELLSQKIQLEADNTQLWNNLYWNYPATRPDRLARSLNSIIEKDPLTDEKFLYSHQIAVNHPELPFTPYDIYSTELTESKRNEDEDDDDESTFLQPLREIQTPSKQNRSNSNTHLVLQQSKKKPRQNLMSLRDNTNEKYLLTDQMVLDYLRKVSDQIYLDADDNLIKPHSIDARLIRLEKFKINQKLFSITVLVTVQPHLYKLPLRCRTNETNNQTSSWITDRFDRLEHLCNNLTKHTSNHSPKETELTQMIKQINVNLSENKKNIEELKARLEKLETKKTAHLIHPGKIFGGNGGGYFNDSENLSFDSSFYLSGITFSKDVNDLGACQFRYTSIADSRIVKSSHVHGNNGQIGDSSSLFHLDPNEKIVRVKVQIAERTFYHKHDRSAFTTKVVTGLRFQTSKGRIIPPDTHFKESVEEEEYPGYVLGYATGKSGLRIDQLQFVWFRTLSE